VLLLQLASDLLVAYAMITLHGAVLMCQAMVFAVAMNSKRHALLALLIASNFVEIKGTVNKRTDTTKLWTLVCLVRTLQLQALLRAPRADPAAGSTVGCSLRGLCWVRAA
jgi:hypothetical protein